MKKTSREERVSIHAIIHSARVDRDGEWKLTLEVPNNDGAKVAALALNTETVFMVQFFPQ